MDTPTATLTCLSCRHSADEHRDYLGCSHPLAILGDSKPVTCVCPGLELP